MSRHLLHLCISMVFLSTTLSPLATSLTFQPLDFPSPLSDQHQKISNLLSMVNETLLKDYLTALLSYGPRMTSTLGCKQAAAYIKDQFAEMNLQTRYQDWTAWGNRWHPGRFTSQNVEATLQGTSDTVIVFGAHYDTVENTVGAGDNGDGVAAVLAAAYVLSHASFAHTLKFVTFSGEEEGLLGSHAYAQEAYDANEDIMVMLNADMIGHAVTAQGGKQFRMYSTEDAQPVIETIEDLNTAYNTSFSITRGVTSEEGRGGSDYFSFVQYGFETVAFFEQEWDQNMHQENDTIDVVNFSYLVNTTRLIVATMAYLADHPAPYPRVRMDSPLFGKRYVNEREITSRRDLSTVVIGSIPLSVNIRLGTAPIQYVEFYYDNTLEYIDTTPPYVWQLHKFSLGEHKVTVNVYDADGNKAHDWKFIQYFDVNLNK